MSKWLDKKKFKEWDEQKSTEQDNTNENQSFYKKWMNPKMGGQGKPKEYEFRLLPDLDGSGYKGYFYHMFQVGETWKFFSCPKTHGLDKYCPWCQITQLLYKGTASDKKKAGDYKRKQKYVSNVYIVNDPRDADESDDERKVSGSVRLYEFPMTVEKMFKKEITDKKNGYGQSIFDPEEDGVNFMLAIEAKKPDANGKVWPDYTPSMFNRRPSEMIEDGGDLDEVMEARVELAEYIDSLGLTSDEHKSLLKEEMVWDDVEDEFNAKFSYKEDTPAKEEYKGTGDDAFVEEEPKKKAPSKKAAPKKEKAKKEEESSDGDEALLDELDNL